MFRKQMFFAVWNFANSSKKTQSKDYPIAMLWGWPRLVGDHHGGQWHLQSFISLLNWKVIDNLVEDWTVQPRFSPKPWCMEKEQFFLKTRNMLGRTRNRLESRIWNFPPKDLMNREGAKFLQKPGICLTEQVIALEEPVASDPQNTVLPTF